MRCRIPVLAIEEIVRIALDEANGRSRQTDLERIEVLEERSNFLVDATMRFVGNDEIKKTDIKLLETLHHRGVGREVDTLVSVTRRVAADNDAWFTRHVLLEHSISLLA